LVLVRVFNVCDGVFQEDASAHEGACKCLL
jgi:hypothetical protein